MLRKIEIFRLVVSLAKILIIYAGNLWLIFAVFNKSVIVNFINKIN